MSQPVPAKVKSAIALNKEANEEMKDARNKKKAAQSLLAPNMAKSQYVDLTASKLNRRRRGPKATPWLTNSQANMVASMVANSNQYDPKYANASQLLSRRQKRALRDSNPYLASSLNFPSQLMYGSQGPNPNLITSMPSNGGLVSTVYDNPTGGPRKAIAEGVKPSQPVGINDMLSAWDKFTINRAYPGTCDAPYLNNMTVMPLPTGCFSISKAISSIYSLTTSAAATPGSSDYVVVMWCPSLSSYQGPGGSGSMSNSTRLGGLVALQTNTLSDGVNLTQFYNAARAFDCSSLYGSDFTAFASGGFVWASQLRLRILAPAANLVGSCYKGVVTLGQLATDLPISQLIQDATVTETGSYEQILRSAVIEPTLVEDINAKVSTSVPYFPGADNEAVSYIVFQTAAASITTGAKMPYTLIAHMDGNFVYYPKANDTFAFSLTPQDRKGPAVFESKRSDWVSELILPKVGSVISDPVKHSSIWDTLKSIGGGIASAADDWLLGGRVKQLDDKYLGSRLQHSVGLQTSHDRDMEEIEKMMRDLRLDHGTTPARSVATSRTSTYLTLANTKDELVPKDDFLRYFGQLDAICSQYRGLPSQTLALTPFFALVRQYLVWYQTAPAWIDPQETEEDSVEVPPDRGVSAKSRRQAV